MQLEAVVHSINQRHGTAYRLADRLSGGTRGAYELVAAPGQRAVLKCATHPQRPDQLRRLALIVERLRAVGYPAPAYLYVGALPVNHAVARVTPVDLMHERQRLRPYSYALLPGR